MKSKIDKIKAKKNKVPIVCLTAYSKNFSIILDKYCDIILVGDSLANVLYGMKNTHRITLDKMISHAQSVKQGIRKSLMVVDLPKNTYKNSDLSIKNAKKVIRETKCDAVKIESNYKNHNIIRDLVKKRIQVMGHIGYTPQFYKKFRIKGGSQLEENKLIKDAIKIEKAGAFAIVLECIKQKTAKKITKAISIPTIGIGSSSDCDGQILVTDDLLGLSGFYPKFVKKYVNLNRIVAKSIKQYKKEVINKKFPKSNNSF
jgi:3-methyl-2-oxobutanoate hydroxymethyltransferase